MKSDLTREDFRQWGRKGGLAGRKTPRRTCSRCGAFLGAGTCKRCNRRTTVTGTGPVSNPPPSAPGAA